MIRGSRAALVTGGVAVAVIMSGCAPVPGGTPVGATVPASPSAPGPAGTAVETPLAWRHAMTTVPQTGGERLAIRATSPNGAVLVTEVHPALGPDSVVLLRLPSGRRTSIQTLPAGTRVLAAAYDGRFVAYTVASTANPDRWTLWCWDSTGGAPRQVAHSATDATGLPVPGPPNLPVLDTGRLFWVQADVDGTTNVRAYTAATRTTTLVRRGHPGTPFALGRLLLWPELHADVGRATLAAYSLDQMTSAHRPGPLAAVLDPASAAASADTVAWVDKSKTELWVWRTSWPAAKLAVRVPRGTALTGVRVAGPIVAWDGPHSVWALDARSMRYSRLGTATGGVGAAGTTLVTGPRTLLATAGLPRL